MKIRLQNDTFNGRGWALVVVDSFFTLPELQKFEANCNVLCEAHSVLKRMDLPVQVEHAREAWDMDDECLAMVCWLDTTEPDNDPLLEFEEDELVWEQDLLEEETSKGR